MEEGPYLEALRQGLRDLGYVEGQTVVLPAGFPASPQLSRGGQDNGPTSRGPEVTLEE
jgi:hypothetical protein